MIRRVRDCIRHVVYMAATLIFVQISGCNRGHAGRASEEIAVDGRGSIQLSHDFGVVFAGETVSHQTPITNPTKHDWTVKRIGSSCACSTSKMSPIVRAGQTELLTLEYRSGGKSADDIQAVYVNFVEAEAPSISLQVKASVRRELSVSLDAIQLRTNKGTAFSASSFEVFNFGPSAWPSIEVTSDQTWLVTQVNEYQFPRLDSVAVRPQQSWQVDLTVMSNEFDQDAVFPLRAGVIVKVPSDIDLNETVVVDVFVDDLVKIRPLRLNFPNVILTKPNKRSISLFLDEGHIPRSRDDVVLHHDMGEMLRLEWGPSTGRVWLIHATLLVPAGEQHDVLNGEITVDFKDKTLPALKVPVVAIVSR